MVARTKRKVCKHAGQDAAHAKRPALYPGPRCASCHREVRNAASVRSHSTYVGRTYELKEGEYQLIFDEQDGKCAICPAPLTYTKRRYAVDHDHKAEKSLGIRLSIRGLLCKRHNNLLRDVRDDIDTLKRAINYLENPPAHNVIERGHDAQEV